MSCRRFIFLSFFFFSSLMAMGQSLDAKSRDFKIDNDFVEKQFGSTCKLVEGREPMLADMDGDGIEDLVLAARCTNPLADQTEHNFTVLDPYYTFYGYGNPKITSGFIHEDAATKGLVVLVIHGQGPETWHAAKEKFVLINLSFKEISLKKTTLKKKKIMAIYTQEDDANQSVAAIFWDGKKYRYEPMGSSLQE
jgi:hypothetical protein